LLIKDWKNIGSSVLSVGTRIAVKDNMKNQTFHLSFQLHALAIASHGRNPKKTINTGFPLSRE